MTFDIKILPQSTQDYLSLERGTQLAVDDLLKVDLDKLPKLADWNELNQYYKARAAAELTKVEWSQSMQILWNYIWGAHIDTDWTMESIKKMQKDQNISIKDCWDEKEINIVYIHGDYFLTTAIEVTSSNLLIAYCLEDKDDYLLENEPDGFKWIEDKKHEWEDWNYLELQGNILENPKLIEDARAHANSAIELCNKKLKW